jgi:hypothetical protein
MRNGRGSGTQIGMSGGHQKAPSFSDQWSPAHIQYTVNIKTKPQVFLKLLIRHRSNLGSRFMFVPRFRLLHYVSRTQWPPSLYNVLVKPLSCEFITLKTSVSIKYILTNVLYSNISKKDLSKYCFLLFCWEIFSWTDTISAVIISTCQCLEVWIHILATT